MSFLVELFLYNLLVNYYLVLVFIKVSCGFFLFYCFLCSWVCSSFDFVSRGECDEVVDFDGCRRGVVIED